MPPPADSLIAAFPAEPGDLATPGISRHLAYGTFVAENPAFFARTQRRVVSYWSCYYRPPYSNYHGPTYSDFRDYPGCALLDLLRSAAADLTEHPVPDLTPARAAATFVNGELVERPAEAAA